MKNLKENTKEILQEIGFKENLYSNLSKTERILSIATGSYFAIKGLKNIFSHPLISATTLALSYSLLNRGFSGYCPLTEELEKDEIIQEPVLIIKETTVS